MNHLARKTFGQNLLLKIDEWHVRYAFEADIPMNCPYDSSWPIPDIPGKLLNAGFRPIADIWYTKIE